MYTTSLLPRFIAILHAWGRSFFSVLLPSCLPPITTRLSPMQVSRQRMYNLCISYVGLMYNLCISYVGLKQALRSSLTPFLALLDVGLLFKKREFSNFFIVTHSCSVITKYVSLASS